MPPRPTFCLHPLPLPHLPSTHVNMHMHAHTCVCVGTGSPVLQCRAPQNPHTDVPCELSLSSRVNSTFCTPGSVDTPRFMSQTPKKQRLVLWGAALMPSSYTPTPPKAPPSSCERSSQYTPGKWAPRLPTLSISCPGLGLPRPSLCLRSPYSSPVPKNSLLLLLLNGCTAHHLKLIRAL